MIDLMAWPRVAGPRGRGRGRGAHGARSSSKDGRAQYFSGSFQPSWGDSGGSGWVHWWSSPWQNRLDRCFFRCEQERPKRSEGCDQDPWHQVEHQVWRWQEPQDEGVVEDDLLQGPGWWMATDRRRMSFGCFSEPANRRWLWLLRPVSLPARMPKPWSIYSACCYSRVTNPKKESG